MSGPFRFKKGVPGFRFYLECMMHPGKMRYCAEHDQLFCIECSWFRCSCFDHERAKTEAPRCVKMSRTRAARVQ